MPIYEYKCKKCGKEFEIEQKITDEPLTVCPDESCGGEIFRKISKNIGLMFKGSGFYLTDYAHKNSSNGNGKVHTNGQKNGTSETSKQKESQTVKSEKA